MPTLGVLLLTLRGGGAGHVGGRASARHARVQEGDRVLTGKEDVRAITKEARSVVEPHTNKIKRVTMYHCIKKMKGVKSLGRYKMAHHTLSLFLIYLLACIWHIDADESQFVKSHG